MIQMKAASVVGWDSLGQRSTKAVTPRMVAKMAQRSMVEERMKLVNAVYVCVGVDRR